MSSPLRKMDYSAYFEDLKEAGFTEKQARGVIRFQHDTHHELHEHMITKNEFNDALKNLVTKNDLKNDLNELKSELKNDIGELKLEVHELKIDFKWLKFLLCGIFMMLAATTIKIFIY